MDCPTCGQPIRSGREAVEIRREWEHSVHRAKAAEEMAETVWRVTDTLGDLLRWNDIGEAKTALRKSIEELQKVKQTFRSAKRQAEAATGERHRGGDWP